jgi:tRNA pseudouridine55 synthase
LSADGLLLIDKPAGITSFGALTAMKNALDTGRIGHTGTLDKFATGLLVVLVGKYTRLAELFSGLDKCYRATILLGKRTDTLDPEGEVVEEGPLPDLKDLETAAQRLTGTFDQVPPVYSALHIEGRRSHRIARSGGAPRLEPRAVTVHRLEIEAYRAPFLDILVECSKGTYVRALARDLGVLSGSCAYVQSLRRLKVGPYEVAEAVQPHAFSERRDLAGSLERLSRLPIGALTARDDALPALRNGRELRDGFFAGPPVGDGLHLVLDGAGSLVALIERHRGRSSYKMVLSR